MSPIISVIVPVYNQERYLEESIESILNQSIKDFELILIDDGSTDKSVEIIKRYAEKVSNIVPIFGENVGKPDAVNTAIKLARGKYVAFMDHDDLMMPGRLEAQLSVLTSNKSVSAVSCQCYYINEIGEIQGIQQFAPLETEAACKAVVAKKEIYNCAFTGLTVEKESFINAGGLNGTYWPCDDMEFFNRFIDAGYILIVLEDILMKYRIHAGGTSLKKQKEMFRMSHFTMLSIRLRRQNLPVISYKEFKNIERKKSLWKRFAMYKNDYALSYHRTAGRYLHVKQYGKFLINFVAATLLWPRFVADTVINKVKKK